MSVQVSNRLGGAFEGALAGGGDPASSPLYVFGPFLKLLAVGGAGAVSFGAPIWMVVATVAVVSLMYRHVMHWVPDGSGGSGLCEEEFGGWAVKVNASITAIEYTLTFLVSLAALVTFIADRAGGLGRWPRSAIAVVLTIAVGVVVNRGPKIAARVFGPATAAVLALLWILVIAVVVTRGVHLPTLSAAAFSSTYIHITLGGYVRLLALMTGIEVFANLVAAYEGSPAQRARLAFGSLLIVMVTTLVTMVIVGPAIHALADPGRDDVSVFTQAMDALLPAPLAYVGTLIGIVVLLSAAAASAQGLQNLALGLRHRHYVPATFGQRNRFDVADRPVILQVLIVGACFVAFGTHEETYLALYAAGVFVLLGLTGWASVKRLQRHWRSGSASILELVGTVIAALLTSGAAALIFFERFSEGAWAYALLVPALYAIFSVLRARLGAPTAVSERLGRMLAERKSFVPIRTPSWPQGILAIIDGTQASEAALVAAAHCSTRFGVPWEARLITAATAANQTSDYLGVVDGVFGPRRRTSLVDTIGTAMTFATELGFDLIVTTRDDASTPAVVRASDRPVLVVRSGSDAAARYPNLARVIVGLDGSTTAEVVLPYAARLLKAGAKVRILAVPDGDVTEEALTSYLAGVATSLRAHGGLEVTVEGSGPARALAQRADADAADLVIVGRHGSGGADRAARIPTGSVVDRLLEELDYALLVIPAASDNATSRVIAA